MTNDRGAPNIGRQPSGYDANLKWKASPGAASYKVYWRQAWTPDWQHEMNVGNVTEFVFPNLSIDDYVFGVAAVGADGNESLVAAYVNPPRNRLAETDELDEDSASRARQLWLQALRRPASATFARGWRRWRR